MTSRYLIFMSAMLVLSGCDEPLDSSHGDFWLPGVKDTYLDGAIRTSTFDMKDGRELEIRCFRAKPDAPAAAFDLRYLIDVPLLNRVVPELQKAGPVQLILSVDGSPITSIDAQPLSHDFGISFLGNITSEIVDKIAAAKTSVVAMPRQGSEKLDEVVEFGVSGLAKTIEPVKKACEPFTTGSQTPSSTKT